VKSFDEISTEKCLPDFRDLAKHWELSGDGSNLLFIVAKK
jgi:hypothetical protein